VYNELILVEGGTHTLGSVITGNYLALRNFMDTHMMADFDDSSSESHEEFIPPAPREKRKLNLVDNSFLVKEMKNLEMFCMVDEL